MKFRICTIIYLLVLVSVAAGQVQRGVISGTVLDPNNSVVANAKITVRDVDTGTVYTANSDTSGAFTVPGLPFGSYLVTIEVDGFRKWETSGVKVITAQESTVKATLMLGSIRETVTVEGAQAVIDTTSAELTTNIDRKQFLDLPLPTRNPVDLAGLQAGVTGGTTTRTSVMNGLRGSTNNITQDGINVQDNFIRSDGFFVNSAPTVENTGEFSISSQNIGSDSGAGVGQVRISTPRGQNELHGSLFYFHRNDAFNANSWTNNLVGQPRDRLRQHRFGGSVGGPVFVPKLYNGHGKSFFFFRYEGFRENFQVSRNRSVLTEQARQGIFRYTGTDGVIRTVNLFSPTINTAGRAINPFMQTLISAIPKPNNTILGDTLNTGGFSFPVNGSDPDNRYTIRIDQKLLQTSHSEHWLEVDWNWSHFSTFPDAGNGNEAAFPRGIAVSCPEGVCLGASQQSYRKVFAAAINSTLGSTIFNEFRFGFSRSPVTFDREAAFPRAFQLRFPLRTGSTTTPFISNPELNFLNQGRIAPVYSFIDNFSKVWKSHDVKAGLLITSTSANTFNNAGLPPFIQLGSNSLNSDICTSTTPTGCFPQASTSVVTLARQIYQTLVGLKGTVTQHFNASPGVGFLPGATNKNFLRERAYNFYFSDSWRMMPVMTVNYGIRYELVLPVDQINRRALQPVNTQNDLLFSGPAFQINPSVTFNDIKTGRVASTKLDLAGTSNGKPFWDTRKHNFAPYVGLAWQPTPKTVLRSGFSVSYVRDGLQIVSNALSGNAGLSSDVQDSTPQGVLNISASQALPPPQLILPVDQRDNFISNPTNGLFAFDRNLRTPYVLQWSVGIQRALSSTTAIEFRYVGNHAVRLYRVIDLGQINVTNGLLDEFNTAKNNLALCRANAAACTAAQSAAGVSAASRSSSSFGFWNIAGQQPLVNLTPSNAGGGIKIPLAFFANSGFVSSLDNNAAGDFWYSMQQNCTLFFFSSTGANSCPGLAAYPANFFVANPLAAFGDLVSNGGSSSYNALQTEVRRRLGGGVQFQGNYTFGKVLTNSSGSSTEVDPSMDLRNARYDRTRATFDIRHTFHFNGIWEIPVGRGRRWASSGVVGKMLEGWQVGSLWTWRSGRPTSILSERGTLNRAARSADKNPAVPVGLSGQDVCSSIGVYKNSSGAFWLPSQFIGADGRADTSRLTNPTAGSVGDHSLFRGCSGPGFNQIDMNFVKRTKITERVAFEFRAEFFNIFNHPNFLARQSGETNASNIINSPGFGVLDGGFFTAREIQFNARINF